SLSLAAYPDVVAERTVPHANLQANRRSALLSLAPSGVCRASLVAQAAGALLPHRFTLTTHGSLGFTVRRSVLCGTFPGLAAGGGYPPLCPVEPGLSSTRSDAPNRDHLAHSHFSYYLNR